MKIDYRNFAWFDRELIERVVDALRQKPDMGRPTLSKTARITWFQAEKTLNIWRDYDLYQYLDEDDAVEAIIDALELCSEEEPIDDDLEIGVPTEGQEQYETDTNYHYDAGKDLYLVTIRIKGKARIVQVPGDTHRAMRQAYSDWDGDRQTLNGVAKHFGVSRSWLQAYKTAMGWTHDSDPFSDEEVTANDPEELAQRAIQRRRHVLEKRYDRLLDAQDRRDAEKYRKIEQLVIEPLVSDLASKLPILQPPTFVLPKPTAHPFAAVISPADLHYGKAGAEAEVDDAYDRASARERLEAATRSLIEHLQCYGRPDEVVVGMANDWFHIDNVHQGTTKGTPQDVDGCTWQVISEGVDLAIWFVEAMRQVGERVRVVAVPANHDEFSGLFLLKLLEVRYAGCEDVEVIRSIRQRIYLNYGITTMGFTHGHHWKKDMVMKILTEPDPEMLYRTRDRVWFTGHRHHEESKDYGGVRWYQLPSLSGEDRWHDARGHTGSRKSLAGYVLQRDQGVVAQLYAPVV